MSPTLQSLSSTRWTVRPVGDLSIVPAAIRGRAIPATIPGCIHTDLMDAGLISDPAVGQNELETQWVSHADWRYECEFEADPALFAHDEIDLVFDCLDTIATIELNGDIIGSAASEFIPHRFSILGLLKPGMNRLAVTFKSPLRHIHEEAARLGARPVNGDWDPFVFIRKCASNFRWDWGPRVATSGIAGSARIEAWSTVRIAGIRNVNPSSELDEGGQLLIDLVWPQWGRQSGDFSMSTEISSRTRQSRRQEFLITRGQRHTSIEYEPWDFPNWKPDREAHAALSTVSATISTYVSPPRPNHNRTTLAQFTTRIGSRDLGFSPDDFSLRIGKEAIRCRGVNWIPEGLWPRDRTSERVRQRLEQIVDCGCNMIRVWGGGRYEPDWFYDLCDELGLMVWQDFMFSCGMYPEEEPLRSLVEAEARYQVARLSRHPCVVLWCGGNECIWGHESWGWKERLKPNQSWGRGYWLDLLPRIVNELDPARPYWPNSPWSGDEAPPLPANDPSRGDRHTWDAKADGYRSIVPRFCSEFGHQSPANYATLARVLKPEDLKIGSPALEHRQRGTGGTAKHIDETLAECFRPPNDFDEWHFLAQLIQARALSTGIEWLRANGDQCSGALIWQMNDAWPCLSWSLVDSGGREKLAWFAVRRSFRPRLLTIQPFDDRLTLVAVDGEASMWSGQAHVRRLSFDGKALAEQRITFAAAPGQALRAAQLDPSIAHPADPSREFIIAESNGHRATWFFEKDKALWYPWPAVEIACNPCEGGMAIQLRTRHFVRDLFIQADRIDPDWRIEGEQPLTLMAGESATLILRPRTDAARARGSPTTWGNMAMAYANGFGQPFTFTP